MNRLNETVGFLALLYGLYIVAAAWWSRPREPRGASERLSRHL